MKPSGSALHTLALSLSLLSNFHPATGKARPSYDAEWWHSINHEEQTGFILGFYDCPLAARTVAGASSDVYINYLDGRFSPHSSSKESALLALRAAHSRLPAQPVLTGGEEYKEKHGWLDGEWWGDAAHGDPLEQKGFVEGYLSCKFGSYRDEQVKSYIHELNSHYGDARNAHDKIAVSLEKVIVKTGRSR